MIPRPAASTPLGALLEMQIIRPHLRPLFQTLGGRSRNPDFNKPPGDSDASYSLRTTAEEVAIFSKLI